MRQSKFLIAENPMVDDHRVFIIHTRDPLIIAETFHFALAEEKKWQAYKAQYEVGVSVDYPGELICIGALKVLPSPDFNLKELPKVMSRMGDWYYAYLKFEDNS